MTYSQFMNIDPLSYLLGLSTMVVIIVAIAIIYAVFTILSRLPFPKEDKIFKVSDHRFEFGRYGPRDARYPAFPLVIAKTVAGLFIRIGTRRTNLMMRFGGGKWDAKEIARKSSAPRSSGG